MLEKSIQSQVFGFLGSKPDIRVFRNNVGMGFVGTVINEIPNQQLVLKNHRRMRFGLMEGSADLIGWRTITVTPDMVGKKIAVFLSIETKTLHGPMKPEQRNWMDQVRRAGGIADIARCTHDAAIITGITP
jgi:hypothetical protein